MLPYTGMDDLLGTASWTFQAVNKVLANINYAPQIE